MRTLLLVVPLLAACGHKSDPAPGPYHDIAGHYVATCTDRTGPYVGQVNPGDARGANVNDAGVLTTTDSGGSTITYQLHRNADGSFTSDPRTISSNSYEILTAPPGLSSAAVTLYQTTPPATLGVANYVVAKSAGG